MEDQTMFEQPMVIRDPALNAARENFPVFLLADDNENHFPLCYASIPFEYCLHCQTLDGNFFSWPETSTDPFSQIDEPAAEQSARPEQIEAQELN